MDFSDMPRLETGGDKAAAKSPHNEQSNIAKSPADSMNSSSLSHSPIPSKSKQSNKKRPKKVVRSSSSSSSSSGGSSSNSDSSSSSSSSGAAKRKKKPVPKKRVTRVSSSSSGSSSSGSSSSDGARKLVKPKRTTSRERELRSVGVSPVIDQYDPKVTDDVLNLKRLLLETAEKQRVLHQAIRDEWDLLKGVKRAAKSSGNSFDGECLDFSRRLLLRDVIGEYHGPAVHRDPKEVEKFEKLRRTIANADGEDDDSNEPIHDSDEEIDEVRKQRRIERRKRLADAKQRKHAANQPIDQVDLFLQMPSNSHVDGASNDEDNDNPDSPEHERKTSHDKSLHDSLTNSSSRDVPPGLNRPRSHKLHKPIVDSLITSMSESLSQSFHQPPGSTTVLHFRPPSQSSFSGVEQYPWEQLIKFEDDDEKGSDNKKMPDHKSNKVVMERIASFLKSEDSFIARFTTQPKSEIFESLAFSNISSDVSGQRKAPISFNLRPVKKASKLLQPFTTQIMSAEHVDIKYREKQRKLAQQKALNQTVKPAANSIKIEFEQEVISVKTEADRAVAKKLLSHSFNSSLASDDWLGAIVWSEADFTNRQNVILTHHALLIDYNDRGLVLPDFKSLMGDSSKRKRGEAHQSHAGSLLLKPALSRFNASHDQHYDVSLTSVRSHRVVKLIHAEFASKLSTPVYRTTLNDAQLRLFHRPAVIVTSSTTTPPSQLPSQLGPLAPSVSTLVRPYDRTGSHSLSLLAGYSDEAASFSSRFTPMHPEDLSTSEGHIILCEFLEQQPLLIANPGMSSQVITYYRKRNDDDNSEPSAEDGDVVILSGKDESPFLGDVPPGRGVTALQNNLFVAPIVKHVAPPNTFLLIRTESCWILRPLPSAYIVGQLEPKRVVPAPHSVEAHEIVRKRAEAFVYGSFARHWEIHKMNRLPGNEVHVPTFDRELADMVDEVLTQVANFSTKHQHWTLKDTSILQSESQLQQVCTPEDLCAFESMQQGALKLLDHGIERLTEAKPVSTIIEAITVDEVKRPALFIEKLLQLTPWSLTRSFALAGDGRGLMQLEGRGNPFQQGAGFSFLVVKANAKSKQAVKNDQVLAAAEPKKKTGTNADLRKLTMEEMEVALRKLGIPDAQLKGMRRWDRVRAMRQLSGESVQEGRHPNLQRFARTERPTNAKLQEEYRQHIQQIFERELGMLAYTSRPDYTQELDDDVAANRNTQRPKAARPSIRGPDGANKARARKEEDEYKEFLAERDRHVKQASNPHGDKSSQSSQSSTSHRLVIPSRSSPSSVVKPITASPTPAKNTRRIKVTRLEHSVKRTLKDGSTLVNRTVYDHPDLLAAFLNDLREKRQDGGATDEGKRLRQALELDKVHQAQRQARRDARTREVDEDGEEIEDKDVQDNTIPVIELVPLTVAPSELAPMLKVQYKGARLCGESVGDSQPTAYEQAQMAKRLRPRRNDLTLTDLLNSALFHAPVEHAPSVSTYEMASRSSPVNNIRLSLASSNHNKRQSTSNGRGSVKRKSSAVSSTESDSDGDGGEKSENTKNVPSRKFVPRTRGDPRVTLSSTFEEILKKVKKLPEAIAFLEPVPTSIPGYHKLIPKPMDLRTMSGKCTGQKYTNRRQFLDDVKLMVNNCEAFNGIDAEISVSARAIEAFVEEALDKEDTTGQLTEVEDLVEQAQLQDHITAVLKMLERHPSASIFRNTPEWPEYMSLVKEPISLQMIRERNLKGVYSTPGHVLADLQLMTQNSTTYNGAESEVTKAAEQMYNNAREYLRKFYSDDHLEVSMGHRSAALALVRASSTPSIAPQRVRRQSATPRHAPPKSIARPSTVTREPEARTPRLPSTLQSPAQSPSFDSTLNSPGRLPLSPARSPSMFSPMNRPPSRPPSRPSTRVQTLSSPSLNDLPTPSPVPNSTKRRALAAPSPPRLSDASLSEGVASFLPMMPTPGADIDMNLDDVFGAGMEDQNPMNFGTMEESTEWET